MTINNRDVIVLQDLIDQSLWDMIKDYCESIHVQDIAEVLSNNSQQTVARLFDVVEASRAEAVFAYLRDDQQKALLQNTESQRAKQLLRSLSSDDLTHFLESLNSEEVESMLQLLPAEKAKHALKLLGYPDESVGRLMNTDFITIEAGWSVQETLAYLRNQGSNEETLNTLYVTNTQGHLLGTVGIKRLVLQSENASIDSLISGSVVCVQAFEDREEAVKKIRHYDINALPVLSREGVMLGVVTVDDVMDVVEQEVTEDFHKMGASGVLNLSLKEARPSLLYRKRVGWLVLLVFMNIFGGAGIAYFEETIEAVIALVFFLPLIVDSGGNAGSQSATLMVRALATGDVHAKDWLRLWGKELGVAIALGLTMGLAVFGLGLWRGGFEVGMVVASSMVLVVMFGSMIGMALPFLLTRMKLDPATASAPLITSVADIGGILIYFSIATAILTIA